MGQGLIRTIGLRRRSGGLFSWAAGIGKVGKYRLLVFMLSHPVGLRILRGFFGLARAHTPVLRTGGVNWTLTHAHTKAALEQSDDIQVTSALSDRLPAGSFLMDIDWPGQHANEKKAVLYGLGEEGGPEVKRLRKEAAERCRSRLDEAGPGPLNVARNFTEELTLDVVHFYFGIGDNAHDTRCDLRRIFRLLASQIFQSAPEGGERALATLKAQDDLLWIIRHKTDLRQDTVFGRLLTAASAETGPWATEDWAARNVAGLAAFGSGTVARAGTQIVYRLLTLDGAKDAAINAVKAYKEELTEASRAKVLQIALEALRFNPMLPLMGVRNAARRTELYAQCPHRRVRIDAGDTVIPSPFAAMFDENAFESAETFRTDKREIGDYLHFGYGRHICVGKHIAEALLEEIVIALFQHPDISAAHGRKRIEYDGPAVETYEVRLHA